MWCFVSQPNSVVLEVEVDQKADGQECLNKVCQQLGIIEVDYFGLQFQAHKGERLWLNLRNRIDEQLGGPPPYRLQLRVKFFVQPHLLLQNTTRHQVYLHVRQEIQSGRLGPTNEEQAVLLTALMTQADYGDADRMMPSNQAALYKTLLPNTCLDWERFVPLVAETQNSLHGLTRESAEYRFLSITSELSKFGVEEHVARTMDEDGVMIHIGVGPEGILLQREDSTEIKRVAYPMIKLATHAGKCLFLTIYKTSLNRSDVPIGFRLVSHRAANALYRSVTEMHSFYRCDTVRDVVLDQYSRDLKGMLASFFNENTTLGKKYVFDIRRTCREAYDHARRKLYAESLHNQSQLIEDLPDNQATCEKLDNRVKGSNSEQECKVLKETLETLQDALTCRVCMDARVDSALCPCGHVICCQSCAARLDKCPLCRATIDQIQPVFLPPIHPHATLAQDKRLLNDRNIIGETSRCDEGSVTSEVFL